MYQLYSGMVPLIKEYPPGEWFQVSRRQRLIARLPAGKTGIEALQEATKRAVAGLASTPLFQPWVLQVTLDASQELECGEFYLKHLCPPEDQVVLTRDEFAAFRSAGGTTYRGSKQSGSMA